MKRCLHLDFFNKIPASPLSLPYAAFISKSVAYGQESGRMVVRETVKVRLAGCPDIRKARGLFEPKGLGWESWMVGTLIK